MSTYLKQLTSPRFDTRATPTRLKISCLIFIRQGGCGINHGCANVSGVDDELAAIREAIAKRDEWSRAIDERAVFAYEAGASIDKVADALGVTYKAARDRLEGAGVIFRPRGRPRGAASGGAPEGEGESATS